MGDFFSGWRWKTGVVTLVMALLFVLGWTRSPSVVDAIQFGSGRLTMEHCVSVNGSLVWGRLRKEDPKSIIVFPVWEASENSTLDGFLAKANLRCSWRRYGFGSGELNVDSSDRFQHTIWIIPYWSIVIPLALISVWLLLGKPRASTQKKIDKPIPEKVV